MTPQTIANMQPLDAALAIFAALGLVHIPGEHDGFGYAQASLPTVPGATLYVAMREEHGLQGMFRARVSDSLGRDFWASDISGPGGNFTRAQTVEQAAKAISRRLLSQGRPEAYVAALRKRHADKHSAVANVDATIMEWCRVVWEECFALGMKSLVGPGCYREARMGGAREVSPTGAFSLSLWGDGPFPNVTLWGEGIEQPVRVRIDDGRSSISFATAAKICALVAFDKQAAGY